jgi:hypothetical protein
MYCTVDLLQFFCDLKWTETLAFIQHISTVIQFIFSDFFHVLANQSIDKNIIHLGEVKTFFIVVAY